MLRRFLYIVSALLLGGGALTSVQVSGADFSDSSSTGLNIFAAPDWTAPDVAVLDPGASVVGTVVVEAIASDTEADVKSVAIQRSPRGTGTWTTLCTANAAPFTCSWDTTLVADGDYDLRAIATDIHDNTKTSATVTTTVMNTSGIVLDPVSGPLTGTFALNAHMINIGSGSSIIRFEASPSGANTWGGIAGCGPAAGPARTCNVNTSGMNGYWDFRAVGNAHGRSYTDTVTGVMVDNTAPVVDLTVPNGPLTGVVNVTATAIDAHSGTASVTFQYRRVGVTTWTTCATDTSPPFACSLNTASLTDGNFEFRASATDNVGNSSTTGTVARVVKNNSIDLVNSDAAVRGTVVMNAVWNGPGTPTVHFQGSENPTGPWATACSDSSPPYTCTIDTTLMDSQRWYVRVVTNSNGLEYDEVATTIVDNVAPTVSLTLPGTTMPPSPMHGTVQLTATAADTDPNPGDESSGIATVRFEYKRGGPDDIWTTCGTDSTAPYTCSLDTTLLETGNYEFRAIATDKAGNSTTTNKQPREVDNRPSATLTSPTGGPGSEYQPGAVITVSADAWAMNGVASVRFERDTTPGPGETWATICTDNVAPYSCSWTLPTAAGDYDVRAIVTEVGGATGTSKMVKVKVQGPEGFGVDAQNVLTAGRPAVGDQIVLTYSTQVNPGSVKSGWNGTTTLTGVPVTLTGDTGGPGHDRDYLVVGGTNLGTVYFEQDYVDDGQSVTFANSSIARSTVTVNGRPAHAFTITLGGSPTNSGALNTMNTAGNLRWKPSTLVTDTYGNACEPKDVNEVPPLDADL